MRILTGTTHTSAFSPSAPRAPQSPKAPAPTSPASAALVPTPRPDWREVTVNEIAVEIPQAALSVFDVQERAPVFGNVAQSAVSGLAFVRAYQGLSGRSLEQKMEGASSLALGVSGVLSMIPGQVAAHSAQVFSVGQAALELSLGVRELHEELRLDGTPDWKEIVCGSLDTVKGASAFVPFFFPASADVVTGVQVAAMLTKAAFESTIQRSTEE